MTLDDIREATAEAAVAAEHLAAHLGRLHDRLAPDFPLDAGHLQHWPDEARERLLHDYPVNARRQAEVINLAWEDSAALLDATHAVVIRLREESLIP